MASGIGAPPGAFIWGWLGDRIGRRTVFIWSAITISLATGIMVFTPGPDALVPGWLFLMFFRIFVGVGNAGIYAIDLPLVQEFIPAYKRGWVSALVTTMLPAGAVLAGFVSWQRAARPPRLGDAVHGGGRHTDGAPRISIRCLYRQLVPILPAFPLKLSLAAPTTRSSVRIWPRSGQRDCAPAAWE